jgi:hypothetical protein
VREYAEDLERHRELLGNPSVQATTSETPRTLVFRHSVKKADLARVESGFLVKFLSAFAASIDYRLSETVGGADVNTLVLSLQAVQQGQFTQFVEDLPQDADCSVAFTIDKQSLLRQVFGTIRGKVLLYFYMGPVLQALGEDLLHIEQEWFEPGERLFLLLGEPKCLLEGEVLHILGGATVDTIRRFVYDPLSDTQKETLAARLNTRAAETHWQNATRFLLPEYLQFKDRTDPEDTAIKPRLNKHLLDLTIASLANFTHADGAGLNSLFEGQKRVEVRTVGTVTVSDEVRDAWFAIYDWTYESKTRDKLAIVRNLLTLQPYSPETFNYAMITSSGDLLLKSARDHYEKFIGESIKEYFDKLKEATTYIQSKVDSVGQQVAALADTLVKNLLATAGFVLGTVISKLLDPKLSAIYPLIVVAFLLYMVVILLVYYPLSWWSYHLTCKEYTHSVELYKRSFTQSDLETFVGDSFKRRKIFFWFAFLATALVHVALFAAGYTWHMLEPFQ